MIDDLHKLFQIRKNCECEITLGFPSDLRNFRRFLAVSCEVFVCMGDCIPLLRLCELRLQFRTLAFLTICIWVKCVKKLRFSFCVFWWEKVWTKWFWKISVVTPRRCSSWFHQVVRTFIPQLFWQVLQSITRCLSRFVFIWIHQEPR